MVLYFACSLKNKEVGYCGKLIGVRGSALLAEREGGNKKVFSTKIGLMIALDLNKGLLGSVAFISMYIFAR